MYNTSFIRHIMFSMLLGFCRHNRIMSICNNKQRGRGGRVSGRVSRKRFFAHFANHLVRQNVKVLTSNARGHVLIEIRLLAFLFQHAYADYRCHRGGHNVQSSVQRDRLVIDRVTLPRVKPGFFDKQTRLYLSSQAIRRN